MNGWDHIRHRRAVFSQETDKLCFGKIIVLASVSEGGDAKNILAIPVPADDHDPVPSAFMAGYRGECAAFKRKALLDLFKNDGQ